ncbi:MAG: type II toxin-antitoxin system RelE/ParE family toxin [Bacteroidales bacterium]
MNITFDCRKLKAFANDKKMAISKLGPRRAQIYLRRLDDMAAAESFADFEYLPGRYHQLTENKKGKWACDLDQPYRLVFEPAEKPIPLDNDGKQILNEIKSVYILEIVNYHNER